jgi:hypothetical protein
MTCVPEGIEAGVTSHRHPSWSVNMIFIWAFIHHRDLVLANAWQDTGMVRSWCPGGVYSAVDMPGP